MRIIELTKANRAAYRPDPFAGDDYTATDDVGENQQRRPDAPAAANLDTKVSINVESIRCFYPRHAERGPGTRITFTDGGGFAVTEDYATVRSMVNPS
jgi:hypothetical protein